MKQINKIGILGGMAPSASNYMYDMLIKLSIQYFGAVNNDDFPEIILYSIPVPDFISNSKDKETALTMLKDRVRDLNKLNISCLSIACNTAHILLDELQEVSKAPFISVIDQVIETVKKDKFKKVGIIGSPSILKSKLYQNALKNLNIESIMPNIKQQQIMDKIIRNVIKGKYEAQDKVELSKIADNLVEKGAEGIILGCTELPLIFPTIYKKVKIYNSVEILSLALLRNYYK